MGAATKYIVTKIRFGSDEEIFCGECSTIEEAEKMVRGYKLTEEIKGVLTYTRIYERKNSRWMFTIRKF